MPQANAKDLRLALEELYISSDVASIILDDFAQRTNNVKMTKVPALEDRLRRAGHGIARRDIVSVLKQLEAIECGRFITGRRGQISRFEWAVQSTSAGRVAGGEDESVDLLDDDFPFAEDLLDQDEDDVSEVGMLRHLFRLRPTLELWFNLPEDFTSAEATRLAEFVKTLPFRA